MSAFAVKARTALALGLPNLRRVAVYRLETRLRWSRVRRLRADLVSGPFFAPSRLPPVSATPVSSWHRAARLLSFWLFEVSAEPPDWLANPLTGKRMPEPQRPWWEIPDFDPAVGDIKLLWELSRMDWVLAFAQQARQGDQAALERLNNWLNDWCAVNPPYRGPNWKCGQEASLRVMHLAMAAVMLGQARSAVPALCELVHMHLQRIAPTVQYAMAQDNNHGTSEAAALFIGGSWLAAHGHSDGEGWRRQGVRWLEDRAARLIGDQGSFSQYSLNYHRVMLDTLSMAEVWRRHMSEPAFSDGWYQRASAATRWLYSMVSPADGDAPNVGANDGARLLQLADTAYRDHRPTVQLAMALFEQRRAYAKDGPWNDALRWLDVDLPAMTAEPPVSMMADDGGFAMLRKGPAFALLRYPRFRFRPSQADALHVDLWVDGQNLLRDGGTFSYNTDPRWLKYFGGTASHNTVQFDDRDQMPRLGRFLLGDWLKTSFHEALSPDELGWTVAAGYRDGQGALHRRRVRLEAGCLRVEDELSGFRDKAVLRWRLAPGSWRLDGMHVSNGKFTLSVESSEEIGRIAIEEGFESRHYMEKTPLPVLEVEARKPCKLVTCLRWNV
jgi:hypothetical protein